MPTRRPARFTITKACAYTVTRPVTNISFRTRRCWHRLLTRCAT
ncbi:hypothetical protein [Pandoraea pulmonicola]